MKVTFLPLVAAALGLAAQVSAGPIRIYVLAPENTNVSSQDATAPPPADDAPVAHMRWGLAAAGAAQSVPKPETKKVEWVQLQDGMPSGPVRKHRCSGGARRKAIKLANWLREKVGLEPIVPHHHMHFPHGHPMPHRPEHAPGDAMFIPAPYRVNSEGAKNHIIVEDAPHVIPYSHHRRPHFHHHRPHSFVGRVQRALMTLGPWEGRITAFVIGCGIGSLLRMFYVLCVLGVRSFRRRDEEDQMEVIFAEVEDVPPQYHGDVKVAPVDEKAFA
ncbi:uncharacterized protein FOMMEDRAFT_20117 [Fomitiporia mediterranea MF3/22]|uniref:uncharacterized protein n=1 Tax=Fomitiporia mediterranea (strain MF3/22) TaxID=694068 RepID=UPI0004407E51|nr:uncharacterized protein FOMMEDRAFT_20117 [Fomitiporia mediterranea MF3/22]EJD02914.1 hypothetical protein FOMMEDRAFT_20117 [Fomitiporia mediterranea MF3/22]